MPKNSGNEHHDHAEVGEIKIIGNPEEDRRKTQIISVVGAGLIGGFAYRTRHVISGLWTIGRDYTGESLFAFATVSTTCALASLIHARNHNMSKGSRVARGLLTAALASTAVASTWVEGAKESLEPTHTTTPQLTTVNTAMDLPKCELELSIDNVTDGNLRIQQDLTAVGVYSKKLDGLVGEYTLDAIRQFDLSRGQPDGVWDDETCIALQTAVPKP